MVQPLAALLSFAFLLAAPPPATPAPGPPAATTFDAVAAVCAVPAPDARAAASEPTAGGAAGTAPGRGLVVLPALPEGAVLAMPTPTDESGWLIHGSPLSTAPPLDLRRPRLVAGNQPEVPHPAAERAAGDDDHRGLSDLLLVRLTKDRGS